MNARCIGILTLSLAACGGVGGAPLCQAGPFMVTCGQEAKVMHWATVYSEWSEAPFWGWTVVVEARVDADHAAVTHHDSRVIEIQAGFLAILPHELEHARLGPASDRHCGWVADGFAAWEETATGIDERSYLEASCQ